MFGETSESHNVRHKIKDFEYTKHADVMLTVDQIILDITTGRQRKYDTSQNEL